MIKLDRVAKSRAITRSYWDWESLRSSWEGLRGSWNSFRGSWEGLILFNFLTLSRTLVYPYLLYPGPPALNICHLPPDYQRQIWVKLRRINNQAKDQSRPSSLIFPVLVQQNPPIATSFGSLSGFNSLLFYHCYDRLLHYQGFRWVSVRSIKRRKWMMKSWDQTTTDTEKTQESVH